MSLFSSFPSLCQFEPWTHTRLYLFWGKGPEILSFEGNLCWSRIVCLWSISISYPCFILVVCFIILWMSGSSKMLNLNIVFVCCCSLKSSVKLQLALHNNHAFSSTTCKCIVKKGIHAVLKLYRTLSWCSTNYCGGTINCRW